MDKENIDGFFTWPTLYRDLVSRFPDGSTFVEVGIFKGQSLLFLLDEIKRQGKKISVIGVDSFEGYWSKYEAEFLKNTSGRIFRFIKARSIEAAMLFADNSIDVVFIDADHLYESVKADIEAWFPKVKTIIAGHDYILSYAGVMKAVDEVFDIGRKYVKEGCWLYEKLSKDG